MVDHRKGWGKKPSAVMGEVDEGTNERGGGEGRTHANERDKGRKEKKKRVISTRVIWGTLGDVCSGSVYNEYATSNLSGKLDSFPEGKGAIPQRRGVSFKCCKTFNPGTRDVPQTREGKGKGGSRHRCWVRVGREMAAHGCWG